MFIGKGVYCKYDLIPRVLKNRLTAPPRRKAAANHAVARALSQAMGFRTREILLSRIGELTSPIRLGTVLAPFPRGRYQPSSKRAGS